jgi:hypothetical protein
MLFDWLEFKQGSAFTDKVKEIAEKLGIEPDSIMMAIWIESEFNRNAYNPVSKAYGLIQILPSTAHDLGLSMPEVRNMSGVEQLEKVVYPYLKQYKGKMKRGIDVYLAIFYPAAVGKPDNYVIAREGSKTYQFNANLDVKGNQNGLLEVFDIRKRVNFRIWDTVETHRKMIKYRVKMNSNYEPTVF